MPSNHLAEIGDLKPEQKVVFDTATLNQPAEFILVQGVAGSGKTTIALNILRQIANDAQTESAEDRRTAVLITYNETLVADCKKRLQANIDNPNMLWNGNGVKSGFINIITYRQFCELLIADMEEFLNDEECIKIVDDIRSARGPESLLSSQIFTLITTFLKGRPDLVEDENGNYRIRSLPELEEYLDRQDTPIYRIYKPILLDVRRLILDEYQNRLARKRKKDRANLSYDLYKKLRRIEEWMKKLKDCEESKLRDPRSTGNVLCDRNNELKPLFDWLRQFFLNLLDAEQATKLRSKIERLNKVLNSNSINYNQLEELKSLVPELITKYGMRGTPIFDKIGNKLKNPVIIVDEVQDLGKMECEIIISLWFQLQKAKNRSKLILFGDLNQQMTPTGFHWEMDVIPAISKRSKLYEYDEKRFNPNWPFINDLYDFATPFRKLDFNYRTSWHIAALAHNLMNQLIPANIGSGENESRLRRHYEDTIIDPNKTFPEQVLHRILYRLDSPELQPKIMILNQNTFLESLQDYLTDERKKVLAYFKKLEYQKFLNKYSNAKEILQQYIVEENEEEIFIDVDSIVDDEKNQLGNKAIKDLEEYRIKQTLVIITTHDSEIVQLKENMDIGTLLTDYPILACKGLEFMGCVVWGLPIREIQGRIELDLIGQWYTSLTRAKVSLLICLTNEEFDFIRNAGWKNYKDTSSPVNDNIWWEHELGLKDPPNVFDEIRNPSREQVIKYLKEVSKTDLGPEESKRAGENAFSRFKRTKAKSFLEEALTYFRWGGWIEEVKISQTEAAQIFEKDNNFLTAVEYYHAVDDFVGKVRCYVRDSKEDNTITNDSILKARSIAEGLARDSKHAEAAECWYWLGEWERAIDCAIKAGEEKVDEICNNIVDIVGGLVENEKYIYKIEFAEMDIQSVEIGVGNDEDARRITEILSMKKRYKEAGQCWKILKEWVRSVDCFIKAFQAALKQSRLFKLTDTREIQKEVANLTNMLKLAENVAEECADSDMKKDCWKKLGEGYYITMPDSLSRSQKTKILQHFWPRSFYFRYVANKPERPPQHRSEFPQNCLELDEECKKQNLYLVATKCWIEVATSGNFKIAERSLKGLISEGVSIKMLKNLQTLLDKEVTGEEEFSAMLREEITDKQKFESLKSLILKHAAMDSTRETSLQEAKAVANSQQNLKDYETAIECWNECWKIEKSKEIAGQIAKCWIQISKLDEAFEIAKDLSQQFGHEVDAIYIMYFTCKLQSLSSEYGKDKCENFISREFWEKGREKVAIRCWKYIINYHESSNENQKATNVRAKAKKVILETRNFVDKWKTVYGALEELYEGSPYKEQVIHEAREILEQFVERDEKAERILKELDEKTPPIVSPLTKSQPKLEDLLTQLSQNVEQSDIQDKTIVIKLIRRIIDESDIELAKVDWENIKVRISPIRDRNILELIKRIDIILR